MSSKTINNEQDSSIPVQVDKYKNHLIAYAHASIALDAMEDEQK